jgi:hypothetical protein
VDEIEAAIDQAIAAGGGDARATIGGFIVANNCHRPMCAAGFNVFGITRKTAGFRAAVFD